jgi:ATP-binding cassette subfamily C protein
LLSGFKRAFLSIGLMTAVINVLYLTGSFFMLEVYDRVIPSRSIPTLVGLGLIAALLYIFQGVLEIVRGRILVRIGSALDSRLNERVFELVVWLPPELESGKAAKDGLQPLRDVDQVRGFLSGLGPTALFDLPWIPLYVTLLFAFHFWIGIAALIGAILLVCVTLVTEFRSRGPAEAVLESGTARNVLAQVCRRNAEVLRAMGMSPNVASRWKERNAKFIRAQERASDVASGFGTVSKVLRMALQSAVLGLGAYLVIQQQATAGIIIASAILTSRALAPVELAINNWRGFVAARQSWRRLQAFLSALPNRETMLELPRPAAVLSVERVSARPPGTQRLTVQDVTFSLKAGNALGIIGPSASGKSSLARLLVGVWTTIRGKVRLDGAAIEQWDPDELGKHIGYLPQDVELFAGTVAENISRFERNAPSNAVIAAAKAAHVHDLILRLPEGYETQIGDDGAALSAGQRQRIALARALYGDPFLIVLDEPNSNLDTEGEQALTKSILSARARNRIVIVVAHRASALSAVDHVLVMGDGKLTAFGPKDEVLSKIRRGPPGPAPRRQDPEGRESGLRLVEGQPS